jgi:hypothetical chaperone protein
MERLVGCFLRTLLAGIPPAASIIVGRPVRFAGEFVDDALGADRLRGAYADAGVPRVTLALEPEAAGTLFARTLTEPATVLIGDFGGGTSDFCLIRLGPTARREHDRSSSILGVDGVPLAGNSFDARLVRAVVSPSLGLGGLRRSESGQVLPIPSWIYSRLERWEDMSMLATPATLDTLRQLQRQAVEPDRVDALIQLVQGDLGYLLYQEVERVKLALSLDTRAGFDFDLLSTPIDRGVQRNEFEGWIAADLARIATCVDRLLERCDVPPSAVDRVFLTGGSSLVPSVRGIFADRFGADRLRGGEELTTVARGLAMMAGRD